ncbi:unnamed protein product [Vicia faba]|uniref:Uncharacterized protein n=1 Tax=Vicia faba TaxID=3906 RepID=A0AAV0Z1H4_VICFA|nr:unnamed protein product [Vicia faba]
MVKVQHDVHGLGFQKIRRIASGYKVEERSYFRFLMTMKIRPVMKIMIVEATWRCAEDLQWRIKECRDEEDEDEDRESRMIDGRRENFRGRKIIEALSSFLCRLKCGPDTCEAII